MIRKISGKSTSTSFTHLNTKRGTKATIIPIPKPGKDHAEPTNYRPIALTSCLCKTLERMINKRLVGYLEPNNLITKFQSGIRAGRSTNDNFVRLESFIRYAFIKRDTWVLNFSPCRGPGGSIPTGTLLAW